jgi:hypothetical protein
MECSGNPRKAQPNLEDTGLVLVDYAGFSDPAALLAATGAAPGLSVLEPALRTDLLRAVLDQVRRARAISSEADRGPASAFTDGLKFVADVVDRLNPAVLFHSGPEVPVRPTVFSDQAAGQGRLLNVRRLAGRAPAKRGDVGPTTSLTRWLAATAKLSKADAKKAVRAAASWLHDYGYLVERSGGYLVAEEKLLFWVSDAADPVGYRCPRCAVRHLFSQPRRCPRCVKVELVDDKARAGDYFRDEYRQPVGARVAVAADEHSAAVSGDERKVIEKRFRERDGLNVVVCTPTMELGVDIGTLAAVYMRNVPPSPANYAQRQGRAGRAAQPSMVVTFCGAQGRNGPHDQYFFRFPERMIAGRIAAPRFLLDNPALVEAHLHSLVLGARGEDLPVEISTWVDLAPGGAGGLTSEMRSNLEGFLAANRAALLAAGAQAFADVLGQGSVPADLVEQVVDNFSARFDREWKAFSAELEEVREEVATLNAKAIAGGLDRGEENRRRALEARAKDMQAGEGDFYPLAYLSQRGFLPTYSFPRRAVLLRFDDRRVPRVRGRSIALREFAPGNHVYHRGRRYEVTRASLGTGSGAWGRVALCSTCGRYYEGESALTVGQCQCGAAIEEKNRYRAALVLPDGFAAGRDRVGAETEERLRQGYVVETRFRLPAAGMDSHDARAGEMSFRLSYVHHGELLQVNTGLRATKDRRGFRLCQKCRLWDPPADHYTSETSTCSPEEENLAKEVVLTNEARHDMLVVDVDLPDELIQDGANPEQFGWSLLYALEGGISTLFGIDESEIDGHLFSHPDRPAAGARLLIFETDEGGIGVLQRVADPGTWAEVCRRALEIVHVQADGTEAEGACEKSCYECLRSFYNQWHHENLDRRLVRGFLTGGATGPVVLTPVVAVRDWTNATAGIKWASATESAMVDQVRLAGLPAPDAVHLPLPADQPVAEADLFYEADGKGVVVLLHGSVHDTELQQKVDIEKEQKLRAKGYSVVVIHHDDVLAGIGKLRGILELPG